MLPIFIVGFVTRFDLGDTYVVTYYIIFLFSFCFGAGMKVVCKMGSHHDASFGWGRANVLHDLLFVDTQ